MIKENLYKFISIFLIILAISSYFIGFYFNENSGGSGSYRGDFRVIWNNFQIFLNNDLISSIQHPEYNDSRTPISYILHELLNPFLDNKINFRKSVFSISILLPILFYFCLKQKFRNEENLLLILISSSIFLSPYFRTSAYWGLQENYGLIFLLLTFLSATFLKEKNDKTTFKEYIKLFIFTLLSSLCFYFDQKLIIIPIICFFYIIFSNKLINLKIFSIFCYFIFSLPYIYLIILWGSLIPTDAGRARELGSKFLFDQIGYATTIIAFYLIPLLLYKGEKLAFLIKNLFSNKKNYLLIVSFILYLIFLAIFTEFDQKVLGKGFLHKSYLILFQDIYFRQIFTYISFFVSWLILLIFFNNNFKDLFIIGYFFIISIFLYPIFQEYFDPLIIVLAFTFFGSKLYPTYKNSIILFLYLLVFLIGSNIYYYNLLR